MMTFFVERSYHLILLFDIKLKNQINNEKCVSNRYIFILNSVQVIQFCDILCPSI
jgi:hypothetical protein